MKKKILIFVFCAFIVLSCLTNKANAATDAIYFYGENLNLQNYNGTELLLNEVNIDVENSIVENISIIKNSTDQTISTLAAIKLEDESLGLKINNLSVNVNNSDVTDLRKYNGNYIFNITIPAGESKKIVVKYQTENNLCDAKIIKYSLKNSKWKKINAFKINIKLPEEDIPLVKNIYPQNYEFENITISAEYYNFNVNVLTQDVIIEKETYKNLLYGRENNFTDDEIDVIKNAKDWIKNGIYVDYNQFATENSNYIKDENLKIIDTNALFKTLLKKGDNFKCENDVANSIMEYALNRQLVLNGENELLTSSFYTFYNESDWNYALTKDYIIQNSSSEIYTLKDKTICIDYVESEGDKTLYVKKNISGDLESITQTEYVTTSEWNILKTKDKSNWSERPETGEKIIYVGVGITGENLGASEEEKIEYVNMINPDLYIRKAIYDGNPKITYTYVTTDSSGKQTQTTEEGYIPIMVGYYDENQNNVAKQYVTFIDDTTPASYYSEQFYNVTTKLFQNNTISEKCLVPTIAQCVGFRIEENGKYVINFFNFGKANGLGNIKNAISDNRAQNLVKINQIKNDETKKNAENEINYATLKDESGKEIDENTSEKTQKEHFTITTRDVIVLATIAMLIIICLIILEINILKKKQR